MIKLEGKYNKDCKIFAEDIEEDSYTLIQNILNEKATENTKVRIMPDTHFGKGIVIGFTMPLTDRVNPFHIGVDIGCGMLCAKLGEEIKNMPLEDIDKKIKNVIPMGRGTHKKGQNGLFNTEELSELIKRFTINYNKRYNTDFAPLEVDSKYIIKMCDKIHIESRKFYGSLGTLGGGNHFIEMGASDNNDYYLTIHSGSRNFGTRVCNYHVDKNKRKIDSAAWFFENIELVREKKDHEEFERLYKEYNEINEKIQNESEKYYLEKEAMFNYCIDMVIAQYYAKINRETILRIITKELNITLEDKFESVHNFIDFEDFIIRKGAIRSYEKEKMIIPFNMRDGILICEGKSNEDWNCSAPHGAGRVLSRTQAKSMIDMQDFIDSMKGIYSSSICQYTLDEAPQAYKDSKKIEELIEPTANIVDRLKPVLNIKATKS